jgi:hypothetical protein
MVPVYQSHRVKVVKLVLPTWTFSVMYSLEALVEP